MLPSRVWRCLLMVSPLMVTLPVVSGDLRAAEPPPGVTQILPRNRIASIDEPVFVSAEEAGISDDAWVMGVVVDGQARAYSLNLLNHHEIVNDQVGEKPFAAVW